MTPLSRDLLLQYGFIACTACNDGSECIIKEARSNVSRFYIEYTEQGYVLIKGIYQPNHERQYLPHIKTLEQMQGLFLALSGEALINLQN